MKNVLPSHFSEEERGEKGWNPFCRRYTHPTEDVLSSAGEAGTGLLLFGGFLRGGRIAQIWGPNVDPHHYADRYNTNSHFCRNELELPRTGHPASHTHFRNGTFFFKFYF
ncbi:hypothetical protein JTE90_016834 [Oedothorax gibbosus]|uniref:Uncharacterized protein n=1 Tax=Oedothorax gibbosus TaxID=931172 RepID=A0AAV6VYT7_9ARAC|nr:hypothetical protein JTE90_016834 [Oedothorax gibbosus]